MRGWLRSVRQEAISVASLYGRSDSQKRRSLITQIFGLCGILPALGILPFVWGRTRHSGYLSAALILVGAGLLVYVASLAWLRMHGRWEFEKSITNYVVGNIGNWIAIVAVGLLNAGVGTGMGVELPLLILPVVYLAVTSDLLMQSVLIALATSTIAWSTWAQGARGGPYVAYLIVYSSVLVLVMAMIRPIVKELIATVHAREGLQAISEAVTATDSLEHGFATCLPLVTRVLPTDHVAVVSKTPGNPVKGDFAVLAAWPDVQSGDEQIGERDELARALATGRAVLSEDRYFLPIGTGDDGELALVIDRPDARNHRETLQESADSLAACFVRLTARMSVSASLHRSALKAQVARLAADEANQAKSDFLSRMSHELRTPMNAILGFAQLLQLGSMEKKRQGQAVIHILDAGNHLLTLINEVLDIARIEAGRMDLSIEPVEVASVVGEVIALMEVLARGNEITVGQEGTTEEWIAADYQRFRQVLINLVSNAVKYNHPGGTVSLKVTRIPGGIVRTAVADTGIGIPADRHGQVFTPFARLGAELTETEGAGIGLALCKNLAEAMGGTLDFESTEGMGSTFWVDLPAGMQPFAIPDEDQIDISILEEIQAISSVSQVTVLYIEDNIANVNVVDGFLELAGNIVLRTAMRGRSGIALAREVAPDVILLDLNLPDMPGQEVMTELRADPVTADIPVVVVTADATKDSRRRLLDAGATSYLSKPLDVREFYRVLGEVLEK